MLIWFPEQYSYDRTKSKAQCHGFYSCAPQPYASHDVQSRCPRVRAGALHSAAQKASGLPPTTLRKTASDAANLSELSNGHNDPSMSQAPLSRRASCSTEAATAAERSRRSSLPGDTSGLAQPGWNPLLQDLPGNFLLVPDLASEAASTSHRSSEGASGLEIGQASIRELARRESYESIKPKSLHGNDSLSASNNDSPQGSNSSSPLVRI